MHERTVEIPTPDGAMPTFVTRPELPGPHPVVVAYMDAPGIREELRDIARRIATVGYYVLLPNLYYRDGGPSFTAGPGRTEAEQARMAEQMQAYTNARAVADTRALLDWVAQDGAARPAPMGCIGWCMSGRIVLTLAGTMPETFRAMVSLHGVGHVTDKEDSPHLLVPNLQGEQYFGFGELDPLTPMEEIARLQETLQSERANALVEVHPAAKHGFVFPEREGIYDKHEAERAWERTFAVFRHQLG